MSHLVLQLTTLICCFSVSASTTVDRPEFETVYWDTVTKSGRFDGGKLQLPTSEKTNLIRSGLAGVTTLIDNGPSDNRIDLVFVGDGYTVGELGSYSSHVNNAMGDFFGIEPLASYLPLFNVHRVDVISNESGVDNDPVNGINRDTAMDMAFWCNNIERLLCVDTSLAWGFANNVASVDAILAVANSSMYGGAGYSWAEIGTFAGGNSSATDVAIHEFGHSMGNLADEYYYTGDTYTGPEPGERNASIYNASQMEANGSKWAPWLGASGGPWDGTVSTYEGCAYSAYGIYRPSNNSMMRALGRPFNQPSAEAFIIEFYTIVDPLDNYTSGGILYDGDSVFIDPIELNHAMSIDWFIDDALVIVSGNTFSVSSLGLGIGSYTLKVQVVDPTPWVRDEAARDSIMTQVVVWTVQIDEIACPADITGDGEVGITDLLAVIAVWGACGACDADVNGDNVVNVTDLLSVVDAWGYCP